ncbi:MAG: endonuclease MutS2 [Deltaproteobacteria bacterium]|nr:endonuclease MutS2 [Deltaproteobacteria bacterium]
MDARTKKLLEFPKILERLGAHTVSEAGRERCLTISPLTTPGALARETKRLRQAMDWKRESLFSLSSFPDLQGLIFSLGRPGLEFLDLDDLWGVRVFIKNVRPALTAMAELPSNRFPDLHVSDQDELWPAKLASALGRCLSDDGLVRDEASPGLQSVRQAMARIHRQCTKKVQDFFDHQDVSALLQDEFLTISDDRYVLALKANFKGRIKGIIHDYSQTGETCYLEPMFLVELNNTMQGHKREEKEEIQKVLLYLTSLARQDAERLERLFQFMVELDVLLAKTRFGGSLNGTVLLPDQDAPLLLAEARHPLLALGDKPPIPVDIHLEPGQRALIVSGGNAGGKTVTLKCLGLVALMSHSALPVPVREGSTLPLLSDIFISMGDEQSIEDNLSTFTAQIRQLTSRWPSIDQGTLVIMDEFGVGTDPSQGAALAQAVVDELLGKNAWIAVATHFPALKAYGLTRDRVRAASVLFDPKTKHPLFRLAYDQIGSSQALDVAHEQGLPEAILARAREYLYLDGSDTGAITDRLNRLALERERELESLASRRQALEDKYAKRLQTLELERVETLTAIREQAREIVRQWRQDRIGRRQAMSELGRLRNETEAKLRDRLPDGPQKVDLSKLRADEAVFYRPWAKEALVREIDPKKAQVRIDLGGISLWAGLAEIGPGPESRTTIDSKPFIARNRDEPASMRLDLRGLRIEEGVDLLARYLDRAILDGRHSVEIIHGKGTGVLRQAVHDFLRRQASVLDFTLAQPEHGGDGVTLVALK